MWVGSWHVYPKPLKKAVLFQGKELPNLLYSGPGCRESAAKDTVGGHEDPDVVPAYEVSCRERIFIWWHRLIMWPNTLLGVLRHTLGSTLGFSLKGALGSASL